MKQLEHKLVIISANFSKKGISGRKQKMDITIAFRICDGTKFHVRQQVLNFWN